MNKIVLSSTTTITRDLGNGQSFCTICEMQFQTKMLTAHANGQEHRESIARLKQQVAGANSAQQKSQQHSIDQSRKHKLAIEEEDDDDESTTEKPIAAQNAKKCNCFFDV